MKTAKYMCLAMSIMMLSLIICPIMSFAAGTRATITVLIGDVNGDGVVNTGDATLILKHCSEMYIISDSIRLIAADVNQSGNVNTADATVLLKMIASGTAPITIETEDPTNPEPTGEPTQAPTGEPTQAPTDEPTQVPTGEPTQAPTGEPTQAPTSEPTQTPTSAPTQAPTSQPTATPAPAEYGNVIFLPGDDSENGGGVKDDGYMPQAMKVKVGVPGTVPNEKIPHSVSVQDGEENAYAFLYWTDEQGNIYYPGEPISIEEKDQTITLTANWEDGYKVLMDDDDIYYNVFDHRDKKYIVGADIVMPYYYSAYFFPIGFDQDSPYNAPDYLGPFTGTFDGAGYLISNFTTQYGKSDIDSCFFYQNSGEIRNMRLMVYTEYSASMIIAGIVGENNADGIVRNCYVTHDRRTGIYYEETGFNSEMTSLLYGAQMGGIAAINNGLISCCVVDGIRFLNAEGQVGGICAYNAATGIVENCVSKNVKVVYYINPQDDEFEFNEYMVNGIISIDAGTSRNNSVSGFNYFTRTDDFTGLSVGDVVLPCDNGKKRLYK